MEDKDLKKILLEGSYVTEENIDKALQYAKASQVSFYEALVDLDLINSVLLGQAIAESYKVSYIDLTANQPVKSVVLTLSEDIAQKYHIVICKKEKNNYLFATDKPDQSELKDVLKKAFPDKEIMIGYASYEDIDFTFTHYRHPIKSRIEEIIKNQTDVAPKLLAEIYEEALIYGVSDIHIEPQKAEVLVRFRVDGVLQEIIRIEKELHGSIINLIKVNADLRIDEHSSSQDGAIRYQKDGKSIDFRVSIIPTLTGEKAVLRILSTYTQSVALRELGLSQKDENLLRESIKRPYGMILITGPTGSGKTTTLYSLIHILNTPNVNITTIEDPVEYEVNGINQVQVDSRGNLTFDKGLRSIVRQDPNIILVGEIRDIETANIAVNASLTGHLLLSTFHANDVASTIPRLIDLGVPPFMIASTLELVATQRLVRTICPGCKESITMTRSEIEEVAPGASRYFTQEKEVFYIGKKCEMCNQSGYLGRKAIFEIIKITPEIQDLILKSPSAKQFRQLSSQQGYLSLFENGLMLVRRGDTTLQELVRVAPVPELIKYDGTQEPKNIKNGINTTTKTKTKN